MKPLVDKKYRLEKFPGKGGWTFARIPEVLQDKNSPFGWVKVRVLIDGVELKNYRLMPMGDGHLFLPVRADIRKKIGKEKDDIVHIILFPDNEALAVPEELTLCLNEEPTARVFFEELSDDEKSAYIKWIYKVKNEETRVERLVTSLARLSKRKKFNDKPKVS
jgi:Domain of unknown function (DUF1905)/Bacteriocin-protection, YdeI or OmpD-Associated